MPNGIPNCAAQHNWPQRFGNISPLQTEANQYGLSSGSHSPYKGELTQQPQVQKGEPETEMIALQVVKCTAV